MEYLGYTRHRNLNTDAESEKSDELIDDLISHRPELLNDFLSLRKKHIKDDHILPGPILIGNVMG